MFKNLDRPLPIKLPKNYKTIIPREVVDLPQTLDQHKLLYLRDQNFIRGFGEKQGTPVSQWIDQLSTRGRSLGTQIV